MNTGKKQSETGLAENMDIAIMMQRLGEDAKNAARILAVTPSKSKNKALRGAAKAIRDNVALILSENEKDLGLARKRNQTEAFLERLRTTKQSLENIAVSIEAIADMEDPVGKLLAQWQQPNGLQFSQVSVPLGVIGIIYESRPNVTADAGALCLKSGNAVLLRCGSESVNSSRALHACLVEGLRSAGLPETAIQLVPNQDRNAVGAMLAMPQFIDVIIPRGGRSLVARVQNESKVPVFAHLEGVCHTYIDGAANEEIARRVTFNAKMRRPGICGATETLLVDRPLLTSFASTLVEDLILGGCEVRGDKAIQNLDNRVKPAGEEDWAAEYLDAIISVRCVKGVKGAIEHIEKYGSGHTEAIITENQTTAEKFLSEVNSAIVMHNTSTQFADGGEFGMGAEIGISTGKLHARGPVGIKQLTSFKYLVRGAGQIRD